MINPVNLNNPGNNPNANSALPTGNGTNPANVDNAAFEASILQAGGTPHGGHGHHGGGNEAYLNGIANLGMINPPSNNNNNTNNTVSNAAAQIQSDLDQTILDTLA